MNQGDDLEFYDSKSSFDEIEQPSKRGNSEENNNETTAEEQALLSKLGYRPPADAKLRRKWLERLKKMAQVRGSGEKTDPFQFFEVEHEPCNMLRVHVLCGREITKGRFGDLMDVPDPYVVVHVPESPDSTKSTRHIDNERNPEWNEELVFYLKPPSGNGQTVAEVSKYSISIPKTGVRLTLQGDCVMFEHRQRRSTSVIGSTFASLALQITLMDSNYSVDEKLGAVEFDVSKVPRDGSMKKTFSFFETSEVDIEFTMQPVYEPDLRYSLALSNEEKRFRSMRKKVVHDAMKQLMGFAGPRTLRETPTIAILGSGGGFRAMTGYAGAIKALHDSGILNCATYIGGLSGSSWYLSTLYSHDEFPRVGPDPVNRDIRSSIASSPFWLLGPESLFRYSSRLRQKRKQGQPVTFTDFFGMLIGQTLLGKENMENRKLSDMQSKIKDARVPMPLFTCLHVRPNMSAMTFHDWVEFTPYEIGIAKYGTFLRSADFGSKFFMGVLVKRFEESPLHFLQGIWGSAFSILFNRLIEKNKPNNQSTKSEDEREELTKELEHMKESQKNPEDENSDEEDEEDDDEDDFEDAVDDLEKIKAVKEVREKRGSAFSLGGLLSWARSSTQDSESVSASKKETGVEKKLPKKSILNSVVSSMFNSYAIMQTREFRAGKILNHMRGLSLNNTYPISPFSSATDPIAEVDEFKHIGEAMECFRKKVHLVDAGLTFNTPYPPILRPQRAVDLIISFDFSARPADNHQPFKEILLAEKWARLNNLPFPKIDPTVYDREGMKECYVFRDTDNERAPVIIHFVLVNLKFRQFSKPGVPRSPGDKRANFDIFDNPKTPYSTFNFQYSNKAFDDLKSLMEFNTLLHVETIKEEIKHCVSLRRHSKSRCSITLHDIRNSRHLSKKNKHMLEKVLGESDCVSVD